MKNHFVFPLLLLGITDNIIQKREESKSFWFFLYQVILVGCSQQPVGVCRYSSLDLIGLIHLYGTYPASVAGCPGIIRTYMKYPKKTRQGYIQDRTFKSVMLIRILPVYLTATNNLCYSLKGCWRVNIQ